MNDNPEEQDDLTPIQPHVITRHTCHSFTDPSCEIARIEFDYEGTRTEGDQDIHMYLWQNPENR